MFVATKPMRTEVHKVVHSFLQCLKDNDFDQIWDYLLSLDSINVMSISMFPPIFGDRATDEDILTYQIIEGMSFAFQTDAVFLGDELGLRTSWFKGIKQPFEFLGWLEGYSEDESFIFLSEDSAVLVADSMATKRTIIIPLLREGSGEFRIDFAAIIAFSMIISARSLHELGSIAEQRGLANVAQVLFDTAYGLAPVYQRLKTLLIDNVFNEQLITPERTAEIVSELDFCILAREQADELKEAEKRRRGLINPDAVLGQLFSNYETRSGENISESDLAVLHQMDDHALRTSLGSIMIGVDQDQLARETAKPHSGFEISDIDVSTEINGAMYYVSFAVKSGREISEKSLPVKYFHQIARPQLTLEKNIVVVVSAKPLSEPLSNMIKQSRDHLDWKITILQHVELARLLKANGLLGNA